MSASIERPTQWTCKSMQIYKRDRVAQDAERALAAVVARPSVLWDTGAVIEYCFVEGEHQGNSVQHQKVSDTMRIWERFANITFNPVQRQNADIRISFNRRDGDWSLIGTEAKGGDLTKPSMNFSIVAPTLEGPSQSIHMFEQGTILHELGHALGLFHEHASPARGTRFTFDEAAVIEDYVSDLSNGPDPIDVANVNVLYVPEQQAVSNYSEVDVDSIMMYGNDAKLLAEGEETSYNFKLSDMDKAYMLINYPRIEPHHEAPDWTFERALTIAKVEPEQQQVFLKLWKENNTKKLRQAFNAWNAVTWSMRPKGVPTKVATPEEREQAILRGKKTKLMKLLFGDLKFDISQDSLAQYGLDWDDVSTFFHTVTSEEISEYRERLRKRRAGNA